MAGDRVKREPRNKGEYAKPVRRSREGCCGREREREREAVRVKKEDSLSEREGLPKDQC